MMSYSFGSLAVDRLVIFVSTYALPALLGYVSLRVFYLLWLHPLADVPGPKLAALTDLWKARIVAQKRFTTALHEQHLKYGDIVRIGPNEVSVVAPDDTKTVYGHNTKFTKGPFYDTWSFVGASHFSARDVTIHGKLRSSVAAVYSMKYLTSLERYCDSCTSLLFPHLDKACESGSIVDLSKLIESISGYTYDCVSSLAFGKTFRLLEDGGDPTGFPIDLIQATETLAAAATMHNFGWILTSRPIALLSSLILGEKGGAFYIPHATRLVKERQAVRESDPATYEEGKDMLYRFMESTDSETLKPLDTRMLVNNTITILAAGSDTTKTGMVAFLRYVYSHPGTVQRIRQEMDDAAATGNLSFPITYAQASRLEFSWACIKEAMRLHPAVGLTLQRVVPAGGCVIGGRFYHAGTLVGMSPHEIHYDSRAYGKDAGEWRPERWLEEDRNELEKFNLIFGQGSRACLGRNISLMEMSKLLPTIVHHYDITIQNPENPWRVSESWFTPQYDFFCTVAKRAHPA